MSSVLNGKWYNQHGSELDLSVETNGRLRGKFRSGVGSPQPDDEFDVAGFAVGELVSFVVNFSRYDSITSWTGHFGEREGTQTVYALWHMTVGLPPGHEQQLWQGIWSGADTFGRARTPACEIAVHSKPSHPVEAGVISKGGQSG
jgi:hypothetical protein